MTRGFRGFAHRYSDTNLGRMLWGPGGISRCLISMLPLSLLFTLYQFVLDFLSRFNPFTLLFILRNLTLILHDPLRHPFHLPARVRVLIFTQNLKSILHTYRRNCAHFSLRFP